MDKDEEIKILNETIDDLRETLRMIGDLAHDRSTGPTVPDGYWEIRALAYGAI